MNPDKVAAIRDWSLPNSLKKLRGFLELTGYYCRFVPNYSSVAAPLKNLFQKNTFLWSSEASIAVQHLKDALMDTILALPDFNKPFVVQTDASGSGIGVVLLQNRQPLAYFIKQLKPPHADVRSKYTGNVCYN